MSTTFELRTSKKVGYATVQVRVQSSILGVNIRQSTKLKVPIQKWKLSRDSNVFKHYAKSKEGEYVLTKLATIESRINSKLISGRPISPDEVKQIIYSIVYNIDNIELKNTFEADGISFSEIRTLNDYYGNIIKEMENGLRHTGHGTRYTKGTINAFKQTFNQFRYFQKENTTEIDFKDIDMNFYRRYTGYLESKGYTLNSIGKCISILKSVLHSAECDGINENTKYKDKRFKASVTEVESVYLTQGELKQIVELDLSDKKYKIHNYVRDIFVVGVCTAQRVSDYTRISPKSIKEQSVSYIEDGTIRKRTYKVIELVQQKTKTKVVIPISNQLMQILNKYDYRLPKVREITINRYIKQIAKMAGIDEIITIGRISGGKHTVEHKPKYELIYSHTARRTGATLMYLAGMDIYDIMKITGHTNPTMLKRYIKASTLDIANKIITKYDYFN